MSLLSTRAASSLRVALALLPAALSAGCEKQRTFEVRIDNISEDLPFLKSGVFETPFDRPGPAPLQSGETYQFNLTAPPGMRLSFATMFVPSNDLFFAADEVGIALYDAAGAPISGDVTDQIQLWDAGTELNEEPGLGVNQAPTQPSPNAGPEDPEPLVRLAEDEFGNLPAVSDVLRVTVTSLGDTEFQVRIDNVSTPTTLLTSEGGAQSTPVSPGVWMLHEASGPLFVAGQPDRDAGLEGLAEDGDTNRLWEYASAHTGVVVPLSPGVWAVHDGSELLFSAGAADRELGLERLAEDGDPAELSGTLAAREGVFDAGRFDTAIGTSAPGVIGPGGAYTFEFEASPDDRLSFATMFVASNDLFFSPDARGIALYGANNDPISGDVTSQVQLWDAGTEVNEEPGVGLATAPYQPGPDVGDAEGGEVRLIDDVDDPYVYPAVEDVLRVTITEID
jgi:hypothetical protein